MINCVSCGTKLVSLSDLTEHLLIDHQDEIAGNVALNECPKCDGWGTILDKHDPDAEHECQACKGTGRVQ